MLRHLVEAGADKDEPDTIGWTAAMWAASHNDIETLAYLHSAGSTLAVSVAHMAPLSMPTAILFSRISQPQMCNGMAIEG